MTSQAKTALEESEVVVSYGKYAKDLEELLKDKELYTSGMTKEIERCNQAIESAKNGKTTSIISNGDVNVFGMATLIVELIDEQVLWDKIEVISIPGVTSFLALASKAGAPVSQDFAIVSLSDRLTDIETINKRVELALEADFVLGIYNPKSKSRVKPYKNFLQSLSKVDDRVAVVGSNVGRENEKITVTDTSGLIKAGLENDQVSMSTVILIGNSNTKLTKNGKILTPRGYLHKYDTAGNIR